MIEQTDIYQTVQDVARAQASLAVRKYAAFGVEQADMEQEAMLWCFEHPKKLLQWLEDEPDKWPRLLSRTLKNELYDYGEKCKAEVLGYHVDDLVYYSKKQLGPLLEAVLNESAWIHPEVSGDEPSRRGAGDPSTGGNWVATLADVAQAFERLEGEDKDILKMFHEPPVWMNKDAAKYLGITEQVMSYRHDRALGRLLRELGGPRPHPGHDADCEHPFRGMGRRTVVSNASARAMQSGYYDE